MKASRVVTALGIGGTLIGFSPLANSAGFQLFEQSISGLGNAFAGGAASAEDASTVFFNPAGMSRLGDSQFIGGVHIISPSSRFNDQGSSASAPLGGAAMAGGDGGDGGVLAAVPNLYLTHAYSDRFNVGLGINVPFGLSTEYKGGWVGRYHGLNTELRTININPAISYKVSDSVTLGMGVSAMYANLREYSNALDSFGICASAVGPAGIVPVCVPAGLTAAGTLATDSHVKLAGDDWGYGANLGILFQPDKNTRIGFHYRSKVDLKIEGDATFTLHRSLQVATGLPAVIKPNFKARVELPETISLSSFQRISDQWDMMGDISWTRWSRFKQLVADFSSNPLQDSLTQPENWADTFRVALGMTYHYGPGWDFRFGAAYDQAAVQHQADRSPRIPDNDRGWLTFGLSYAATDSLQLDLSYAHLFMENGDTRFADATFGHRLIGEFETDVDILSGQVRWIF